MLVDIEICACTEVNSSLGMVTQLTFYILSITIFTVFKYWMSQYAPSPYVYQVYLSPPPPPPPPPSSTNMTILSNDPTWWPTIRAYNFSSYFVSAALVGVTYDWVLTFGQEVELVWRQRWSLMTVLYLSVRYLGIVFAAVIMLGGIQVIPLTDTVSFIMYAVRDWMSVLVFAMLWVIMITRLYAMYQRSRKILIYLVVTFLAVNIFTGVVTLMITLHASAEALILSGTYQCSLRYAKDSLLDSIAWMLTTVWEVLALCLAGWIAIKRFRELRQHSAEGIIEDCFTVLMKTHVLYFASFIAVSCLQLIINFSSIPSREYSVDAQLYVGFLQIFSVVQMFVLGPRLIISIREYHAKLVADSDAVTDMTSIAFQERAHILTGSSV
ncbi:uncharacterized protein EDB93DRAFT_1332637 [Suillus bovinus]|uniref:uncharacterized protein n=1 Tax=Suillus bovinus TaxID=48563 RepID=UPI001B876B02|nr:uncharacterized protein EDB93DRAFT_1332637 [Suillus bovinus]KAG2127635.1 hypothetical protein EDB93DRAFT_1332637 [Suillus bovinus]